MTDSNSLPRSPLDSETDQEPVRRAPEYMVYYIAAATVKGLPAQHVEVMCANLGVDPVGLKHHLVQTCNSLGIDLDSV